MANATDVNGRLHVPGGRYGPVGLMIGSLTTMAQTGGLDGTLLSEGEFYNTNYTKPLLFLADGTYLADKAQAQHLSGSQWGMMNETGNYPGQAWLWLYTMWYQVSPMNSSTNGDLEVWLIMMVLSVVLIFLPFIPICAPFPAGPGCTSWSGDVITGSWLAPNASSFTWHTDMPRLQPATGEEYGQGVNDWTQWDCSQRFCRAGTAVLEASSSY